MVRAVAAAEAVTAAVATVVVATAAEATVEATAEAATVEGVRAEAATVEEATVEVTVAAVMEEARAECRRPRQRSSEPRAELTNWRIDSPRCSLRELHLASRWWCLRTHKCIASRQTALGRQTERLCMADCWCSTD